MKLKNVLLVVNDVERAKKFYHEVFGLDVVLDNAENIILTEGLVLQDRNTWENFLGRKTVPENNSCELYFEETNMEAFVEKLLEKYPEVQYASRLAMLEWGQKMVRFYDLDGNLIEVRTPV